MQHSGERLQDLADLVDNHSMSRVLFSLLVLAGLIAATPAERLVEVAGFSAFQKQAPQTAPLRVVNVWATWCVPCVEEMPDLQKVDDTFASKDVEFVGISLDDAIPGDRSKHKRKVLSFLDGGKIKFRNVYYTGKLNKLQDDLRFEGEIPVTFIFDRQGRELWRHQGKIDRQEMIRVIRKLQTKRKG